MLDRLEDFPQDEQTVQTWSWMEQLLAHLKEAGMSSEESDTEAGVSIKRVRRVPWRRDVSKIMEYIEKAGDKYRSVSHSTRGAKPVKRIRNPDATISDRAAPKKLPRVLYNQRFIERVGERTFKYKYMPRDGFEWLDIAFPAV